MREAFPPCLPITNSSGIENNNNNHKEFNYNHHTTHTTSCNNCHKEKDLNIDRNNETTRDIPINETEKICFDSDEGKESFSVMFGWLEGFPVRYFSRPK